MATAPTILRGELGADYAFTGVVYKVSELVLSMSVLVHEAATSQPMTSATVDLRGNTDEFWRRAIDYLYRNVLSAAGGAEEMTKMLASVTGVEEAEIAIAGGVDIIDLKDPKAGALGAVATDAIRRDRLVGCRTPRRPARSAATCRWSPKRSAPRPRRSRRPAWTYVKIGFFPSEMPRPVPAALAPLAMRTKLIAVLFADLAPDFDLLPVFAKDGFHGAMVDTADKAKGRLLDHLPPERIPAFVERARSSGLVVGLTGSLEAPDIPRLLPSRQISSAFAALSATSRERTASLDAEAIAQIRDLIPEERRPARRPASTIACWRRAAIRRTASTRRWAPTRSSCAILSCRCRSAPTVSSTATPRRCAST